MSRWQCIYIITKFRDTSFSLLNMLFPLHPPKAEFQKVTHSRVNQGFGLIDHLANPGLLEHLAGGMGRQKKKYFLFFFCQK